MNCEQTRALLAAQEEPAPELLDQVFEHLDACAECRSYEEGAAPGPILAFAECGGALVVGVADSVMARIADCREASAILDASEEPSPERLDSTFAHIDSCPPCSGRFAKESAPAPLAELRQQTPDLSLISRRVMASIAACSETRLLLEIGASEPSSELADRFATHLADCGSCAALESERTPELARWAETRQLPTAFAGFSERVMASVAADIETAEERIIRPAFGGSQQRSGLLLAIAAALVLGLTVLMAMSDHRATGSGVVAGKDKGAPKARDEEAELIGELKAGPRWAELSRDRKVESFENEATLPKGKGVEFEGGDDPVPALGF